MGAVEKEFIKFMSRFDQNPFEIVLDQATYRIGTGEPAFAVVFHKVPAIGDLLTSTSIALGEAYMDGSIEIKGKLYDALNLLLGQLGKFSVNPKKLKNLFAGSVSKRFQKKEVSSHYDIGNDFYRLWLDETMSYSCAYFEKETDTLYDAQRKKTERILKKLRLENGMTLCDIGCGWGFLLIEAAKRCRIHGVGITLSEEQKKEFERRIQEEGLAEYLTVKLLDYRDLKTLNMQFDRVVSIGMLEHVGRKNYAEFMRCVKSVLKPGGIFFLHYISALKEHPGDAWVKKYIFPGGMVPSFREIISLAAELRFYTLDVESLRRHYNRTLLCWNENFQKHRREVVRMFDEKFARMWELYLCSCAATFMNGIIDLHQIIFTNDVNNELPTVRWY